MFGVDYEFDYEDLSAKQSFNVKVPNFQTLQNEFLKSRCQILCIYIIFMFQDSICTPKTSEKAKTHQGSEKNEF